MSVRKNYSTAQNSKNDTIIRTMLARQVETSMMLHTVYAQIEQLVEETNKEANQEKKPTNLLID